MNQRKLNLTHLSWLMFFLFMLVPWRGSAAEKTLTQTGESTWGEGSSYKVNYTITYNDDKTLSIKVNSYDWMDNEPGGLEKFTNIGINNSGNIQHINDLQDGTVGTLSDVTYEENTQLKISFVKPYMGGGTATCEVDYTVGSGDETGGETPGTGGQITGNGKSSSGSFEINSAPDYDSKTFNVNWTATWNENGTVTFNISVTPEIVGIVFHLSDTNGEIYEANSNPFEYTTTGTYSENSDPFKIWFAYSGGRTVEKSIGYIVGSEGEESGGGGSSDNDAFTNLYLVGNSQWVDFTYEPTPGTTRKIKRWDGEGKDDDEACPQSEKDGYKFIFRNVTVANGEAQFKILKEDGVFENCISANEEDGYLLNEYDESSYIAGRISDSGYNLKLKERIYDIIVDTEDPENIKISLIHKGFVNLFMIGDTNIKYNDNEGSKNLSWDWAVPQLKGEKEGSVYSFGPLTIENESATFKFLANEYYWPGEIYKTDDVILNKAFEAGFSSGTNNQSFSLEAGKYNIKVDVSNPTSPMITIEESLTEESLTLADILSKLNIQDASNLKFYLESGNQISEGEGQWNGDSQYVFEVPGMGNGSTFYIEINDDENPSYLLVATPNENSFDDYGEVLNVKLYELQENDPKSFTQFEAVGDNLRTGPVYLILDFSGDNVVLKIANNVEWIKSKININEIFNIEPKVSDFKRTGSEEGVFTYNLIIKDQEKLNTYKEDLTELYVKTVRQSYKVDEEGKPLESGDQIVGEKHIPINDILEGAVNGVYTFDVDLSDLRPEAITPIWHHIYPVPEDIVTNEITKGFTDISTVFVPEIKYYLIGGIVGEEIEMELVNGTAKITQEVARTTFNIKKTVTNIDGSVTETIYGPANEPDSHIMNLDQINKGVAYENIENALSWVFSATAIPDSALGENGTDNLVFYFNTRNGVLTIDDPDDHEVPYNGLIIYQNGLLNPNTSFYSWWNVAPVLKATDPSGTYPAVFEFKSSGVEGPGANCGINLERKESVGMLHDAILNFDFYAVGTGTYTITLTSGEDNNNPVGNSYKFITITEETAGKWHHVSLNVPELFPEVAASWERNDKEGIGYVFAVILDNASEGDIIYFNNIYYSKVDKNIKKEPVDWSNITISDVDIRVWEGPLAAVINDEKNAEIYPKHESATSFHKVGDINGKEVWKLEITDKPQVDPYVSQFELRVNYGTGYKKVMIDAHSENTYVDAYSDFWCMHSRMEPGVKVNTIYFIYDKNKEVDEEKNETPFQFMFSSDGEFHYDAYVQPLLNSDNYSIRISSGKVYDALKGTQPGSIVVPFIRHHIAKEGFSINLGKEVTLTENETFTFMIKGVPYRAQFDLTKVYSDVSEDLQTPAHPQDEMKESMMAQDLTFNKIVLIVGQNPETGKYDQYSMYLLDKRSEPVDFIANGYRPELDKDGKEIEGTLSRKRQQNPKLKIWDGNDATWEGLYDSSIKFTPNGNVKLYDFEPIMTYVEDNETGVPKKTNIYYLPLPNGVEIKGFDGVNNDMFNILDNEGYDISNPYQGSQIIYPQDWWCVNPSLGYEHRSELRAAYPHDTFGDLELRTLDGFYFPPLDANIGMSVVDLGWGVNTANNTDKIYGITMFKIMGYGYDVYAGTYKERPLYYLYAEKDPAKDPALEENYTIVREIGPDGTTVDRKEYTCYEKSAPILLHVKDDSELKVKSSEAGVNTDADGYEMPKSFTPTSNNKHSLDLSGKYYQLGLSDVQLTGNDDLNWLPCDQNGVPSDNIKFRPLGAKSIEFVDVTGHQTWDAYGEADRLTPNRWSNYYSTYDDEANDLVIDQTKNIEYFRMVLATNPDAVRYQILSEETTMHAERDMRYDNMHKPLEASEEVTTFASGEPIETSHENIWIYPTATIKGNFFWRTPRTEADPEATQSITISLDINDGKNETVTKDYGVITYDAAEDKYLLNGVEISEDMIEVQKSDEAFLLENEHIFTVNLGEFFADPDWTMTATSIYKSAEGEEVINGSSVTIERDEFASASVGNVVEHTYGEAADLSERSTFIQNYNMYLVQLKWLNDEHKSYDGLPRTYEVTAQQIQRNDEDVDGYPVITLDTPNHVGYWWPNIQDQNPEQYFSPWNSKYYVINPEDEGTYPIGWTLMCNGGDNADIIDGKNIEKVTINYTVTPIYHYAVPKEAMYVPVPKDYKHEGNYLFGIAPTGGEKTKTKARALVTVENRAFDPSNFVSYEEAGDFSEVPIVYGDRNVSTSVEGVTVEAAEIDGTEEIYTLQGVKVVGQPEHGIYIVRKGGVSKKVIF